MTESMEKRLDRLEWETGALKQRTDHMGGRLQDISLRMDAQHRETLAAIGSLKDEQARAEGRAAAELEFAQKSRDRMKGVSVVIGIVGLLAALGWISSGEAKPATLRTEYEEHGKVRYP